MATDKDMVEYIVEQIEDVGEITYLKMFGEYGIYSDGKIFGLICDNKLYLKPTSAGREFISNLVEAPPYPGAKNYFLVEEELDNSERLSQLIRITIAELPTPKPKEKKKNLS